MLHFKLWKILFLIHAYPSAPNWIHQFQVVRKKIPRNSNQVRLYSPPLEPTKLKTDHHWSSLSQHLPFLASNQIQNVIPNAVRQIKFIHSLDSLHQMRSSWYSLSSFVGDHWFPSALRDKSKHVNPCNSAADKTFLNITWQYRTRNAIS